MKGEKKEIGCVKEGGREKGEKEEGFYTFHNVTRHEVGRAQERRRKRKDRKKGRGRKDEENGRIIQTNIHCRVVTSYLEIAGSSPGCGI